MPKKINITDEEIITAFHLIRKSANSLTQDLKYFSDIASSFDEEQTANILGCLEEVEQNIEIFNKIFANK